MRIGINAIFFVPGEGGGIERYLRNLVRALQKIDHRNEYVLFTNKNNTATFALGDNFREQLIPVSASFRSIKILWEQSVFPLQVKRAGIDLLFSPGNIAPLFPLCPSVVVMHDLIPFEWPENFGKLELQALKVLFATTARRAKKIITVSESSKKQIVKRFNLVRRKVAVVYEACDEIFLSGDFSDQETGYVKKELGITRGFILYTASTRPHKNVDGLLRAFGLLKKKYNIKQLLVIAGPTGPEHHSLLHTATRLGISNDVIFTGYVPDRILPALYSAASLFVYPSFYEGFGLPILEAMACGIPVVASNTTSLPEVVGNAGVLVNPHNFEEMAGAMYNILSDDKYSSALVALGKKKAQEFSWEKTAKGVSDVFCELGASEVKKR